jgi:hypothetical protein
MRKTIFGILLLIAIPAAGFGQNNVESWENLRRLKARNTIRIIKANSPVIDGKFVRFSADEIFIEVDKRLTSIQRSDVQRIDKRKRRLFRGLIGAGIGAAAGLTVLATSNDEDSYYGFAIPFFPVAIGAGAATGALLPDYSTVYRSPK